jgi:hypothetical protein
VLIGSIYGVAETHQLRRAAGRQLVSKLAIEGAVPGIPSSSSEARRKERRGRQLRMLQGFITCHLPFGPLTKPYFAAVSGLPKMAWW